MRNSLFLLLAVAVVPYVHDVRGQQDKQQVAVNREAEKQLENIMKQLKGVMDSVKAKVDGGLYALTTRCAELSVQAQQQLLSVLFYELLVFVVDPANKQEVERMKKTMDVIGGLLEKNHKLNLFFNEYSKLLVDSLQPFEPMLRAVAENNAMTEQEKEATMQFIQDIAFKILLGIRNELYDHFYNWASSQKDAQVLLRCVIDANGFITDEAKQKPLPNADQLMTYIEKKMKVLAEKYQNALPQDGGGIAQQ
jgi:hypothetical protein